MRNINYEHILIILHGLTEGKKKSHEELIELAKNIRLFSQYKSISDEDIKKIVFEYEKIYGGSTFKPGKVIYDSNTSTNWFYKKKAELYPDQHGYQERYEKFLRLKKFFPDSTIEAIRNSTEKILSFCANPESSDKRRGMVVGDVQSGKTSNYLELINMACDYGYKLILVLAGLTDSLRLQTQERIDEGFVGAVSSTIGDTIEYTGVGLFDFEHYAVSLTDIKKDFSTAPGVINDFNKPIVLVVKKNKRILELVKKYLKPGSLSITSKNILIIDDECDNASVNTKTDDEPSAINSLIRQIYNNFTCASYIGFTATPFANIFINPELKNGNDDLFPNDFIYRLKASPEAYFGCDKIFPDYNSSNTEHLVIIDENEDNFLKPNHKKDDDFVGLSESLKNSICNFLIGNCIRTLRGYKKTHRTMMINISRFNSMQYKIYEHVERYIEKLKNTIISLGDCSTEKMIRDKEMKRIYSIYTNDTFYTFKHENQLDSIINEYSFEEIKSVLYDEIILFKTVIINNKFKGDMRFDYKNYKDVGARVIAIGGFVLSRGLTLEGLMISYFVRNATAYDTLLQMCRWFGYRPHYEDLCRIYMTQLSVDSFGAVIDAVRNLDEQFDLMRTLGKTPREFGLMVEESPDTLETTLLITSRNKMKNSTTMIRGLNYSGVDIDTSKLYKSSTINKKNMDNLRDFFRKLNYEGYELIKYDDETARYMFKNVDAIYVGEFLKTLKFPVENKKLDIEYVSKFISEKKYYKNWDIVIATGKKSDLLPFKIYNYELPPVQRQFAVVDGEDFVRVSKNKNRLLEPGIFNSGLTDEQVKFAKNRANERKKGSAPIASDYLAVPDRNPLLVILPVALKLDGDESEKIKTQKGNIINSQTDYILGIGLGFAGRDGKVLLNFRINKIQEELIKRGNYQIEEEEIDD